MHIRRPAPREAGILTDLILRSKKSNGYDDAFIEACRDELAVTPDRLQQAEFWVAESDAICGCASISINEPARTGEVGAFFIHPDFKRQGIGQQLWAKLLERAEQERLTLLHLDSDPFAVPFYEKQGFRIIRQTPSGSIAGRTIPYMELQLVPDAGGPR